jgi:GNAT superfamily N-acetyltransferase
MGEIEYRLATEGDTEALARIRWDSWLEHGQDPPEVNQETFVRECGQILKQRLLSRQWTYWLAILDGEIISQIFIQRIAKVPKPSKIQDAFGYVTNVYTRPAYRGQGIGSRLLAQVNAWAKEQDLEFLILWPSEESISFYERAGFAPGEVVEYSVRPYVG